MQASKFAAERRLDGLFIRFAPYAAVALIFSLTLGACLMLVQPKARAAAANDPEVYKLSNGLTVVLQEDDRFPLVSMRYYVHAGSTYETPKEAGISHLLEHMVFKGTQKRPKGGVAEDIESVGGYINAATSFDYTVYITDVPAEHWKTGLDVLHDMAFNAVIDKDELESEKKVVIAELKRGEDSPGGRLFKMLQASSLVGTPYQHPIIGYENVLNAITRDDILSYISRYYQPQSTLLLVCGNIDKHEVRKEIHRLYGQLVNTAPVPQPEVIDVASLDFPGPKVTVEKGPWNKVYLGVAFPSISQQDQRTVHLDVLSSLLGDGKTSYLYRKYKYEQQLVDSISVSNYSFERMGLLMFNVVLDEDKLDEFWAKFIDDLKNLDRIKFSVEELERVKLNLEDDLFRSKETLSGLASKLGYFEFFDNGSMGESNYLYLLRNTALNDVRNQMDDLVIPERMSVAALLPESYEGNGGQLESKLAASWPARPVSGSSKEQRGDLAGREEIELGRGRRLILIPDNTLPYISATMMFTGGDALQTRDTQGLATATASMLTKGAGRMSATVYENYLADRASSLTASAGRQSFSLALNMPERFSADIFQLLGTTLESPSFREDELERVKRNQLSAIKSAEDQPLSLAFRRIFPFLFGDHPYGYLKLGTPASVEGVSVSQVEAFWQKQKAQPWVLAVCGNFDREAIIEAAGKLPVPSASGIEIQTPLWTADKDLTLNLPGRHQYHLMLVFPTVSISDADAPAVDLLQSVLSGQSGLLFSELRDKQGLGYTVTAMPWNTQKTGALIFYIGTEPEKAAQAREGFVQVIRELQAEALPEAELRRGKNAIQGEYYRGHQSLGSRSSEAATLAILGLPPDHALKQIEQSSRVTPEQLRQVAEKYLDLGKSYQVVVKP